MSNQTKMIECVKVDYAYKTQTDTLSGQISVLKQFNLSINQGDSIAIVGQSGSGKSTLLNLLAGLDQADSGKIYVKNQDLSLMNETKLTIFRAKHLGFIYQFHHLLDDFTALDNIAMPLLIKGDSLKNAQEKASLLLNKIHLADRANHYPNQLSGGQRQRIAVARALIHQPSCILADEPTGNLDKDNANLIIELLLEANRLNNTTLIMVTHNQTIAKNLQQIIEL